MKQNKLRWLLWGAGIGIIVILLITLIYLIIDNKNNVTMKILVTPQSAKIIINEKEYQNGSYKVPAGSYDIKISKEGFVSQEQQYEVGEGGKINIYAMLEQEEGKTNWYDEHEEDALLVDPIMEYLNSLRLKEQKEKYPLLEVLPIEVEYYEKNYSQYVKYKIYGEISQSKVVIRIVDYTGDNYEKALENIRARGYRPEDYQVIYDNLNS